LNPYRKTTFANVSKVIRPKIAAIADSSNVLTNRPKAVRGAYFPLIASPPKEVWGGAQISPRAAKAVFSAWR
jgi:hypothetical protein